ncbi:MAG: carboxypeptidase-like regulatory domain-containing protein [Rhodothermales bacterium]
MKYSGFLLLLALCLPLSSFGASLLTGTIQGVVVDNNTGEPLPGANILLIGTQHGTATNTDGQFTLSNVEEGLIRLTISMIGYTSTTIEDVSVTTSQTSDIGIIRLERSSISLKEITVTPGNFSIMGSAGLSQQTLTQEDIKNMSWAEDVTRAVARLPGISSSDFSSKFAIRGGESDEVLITLDGMELYEPFHQRDFSGGLFSIVDIETIDGIDLMTGGYSAEYGNRLSGVFNMRTKKVATGQKNTSVGLSFLTARFYTDGSFGDGKGS